jgi:hypothetical protein
VNFTPEIAQFQLSDLAFIYNVLTA